MATRLIPLEEFVTASRERVAIRLLANHGDGANRSFSDRSSSQDPASVGRGIVYRAQLIADDAPIYRSESAVNLILQQNTKAQAKVLTFVARHVERFEGSLPALRADGRRWTALRSQVATKIVEMPLYRLQRIGTIKDPFLYEEAEERLTVSAITLRPGISFTLSRFHGLIQEIVRSAWMTFVRGLPANRQVIGEKTDLYEFLFGSGVRAGRVHG